MKTLKREDFKAIHAIACGDWRLKLIDWYGSKFAVEDVIEIKDSEYSAMRSACTEEQHKLFDKIFGKDKDIIDTVDSLEAAINILGKKDEEVILLDRMEGLPRHIVAEQELIVIHKALNQGWIPDWSNTNQRKWHSWWHLGEEFRLYDCDYFYGYSYVPARLCLKEERLIQHSVNKFKDKWKEYLNK